MRVLPKYEIEVTHRYFIYTEDIREVQKDYGFPDLNVPSVDLCEFVEGSFHYEEVNEID